MQPTGHDLYTKVSHVKWIGSALETRRFSTCTKLSAMTGRLYSWAFGWAPYHSAI